MGEGVSKTLVPKNEGEIRMLVVLSWVSINPGYSRGVYKYKYKYESHFQVSYQRLQLK